MTGELGALLWARFFARPGLYMVVRPKKQSSVSEEQRAAEELANKRAAVAQLDAAGFPLDPSCLPHSCAWTGRADPRVRFAREDWPVMRVVLGRQRHSEMQRHGEDCQQSAARKTHSNLPPLGRHSPLSHACCSCCSPRTAGRERGMCARCERA